MTSVSGPWTGRGVVKFDEGDSDFGAFVVERSVEVLFGVRPPVGKVVVNAMRSHRVENVAQPAGLIGGLDGALDELGGLIFPSP